MHHKRNGGMPVTVRRWNGSGLQEKPVTFVLCISCTNNSRVVGSLFDAIFIPRPNKSGHAGRRMGVVRLLGRFIT